MTNNSNYAGQIRQNLIFVSQTFGEIAAEWKVLRETELHAMPVAANVRLTVDMIARRAEANCRNVIGQVLLGLAALDRGDLLGAGHALEICTKLIALDEAADDVVERLIGHLNRHGSVN
jgi:hypothetical protein